MNTSNAMHLVSLIKQKDYAAAEERFFDKEVSPNTGAPFGMKRETMLSPLGMPCNPPPWGQLHAIDMHDGNILWSVPLGTTEDMAPFSEYLLGKTGTPNLGGPMATAGGVVFIGAAMDDYLRAFDAKTGAELWRGRLPAGGQATPMSYVWKGRQYVVIAAGGHSKLGTQTRRPGDRVRVAAIGWAAIKISLFKTIANRPYPSVVIVVVMMLAVWVPGCDCASWKSPLAAKSTSKLSASARNMSVSFIFQTIVWPYLSPHTIGDTVWLATRTGAMCSIRPGSHTANV